jgi:AcrR family transcriptional regulator
MTEPAREDLTARARIRDAALRLFAERGTEAATIRDIAAQAGVSLGLVRHHFGSKDALRAACDEYALAQVRQILAEGVESGATPSAGFALHPTIVLLLGYFARSMSDGSQAADEMFAEFVAVSEQWLAHNHPDRFDDPKAVAVMLTAMQIGPLVLHNQVSAALGVDLLSMAGQIRSAKTYIDIYTHPWLSTAPAEAAKATYARLDSQHPITGETP